jgi:16S rRNA C1402 N4-methylase RsmH
MDTNLAVAIVAASASMLTGISGMWINASQTGKRIDDLRVEFHAFRVEIKAEVKELRTELTTFRDMVNGKLQAIDFEIAKLMDRPK